MHFLGFLLTIGILMSVTSPSFATVAEHSDYYDVPAIEKVEQTSQPNSIDPIIKEQQEIEIAQKSYQSLSDEQKVYFEQISNLNFYRGRWRFRIYGIDEVIQKHPRSEFHPVNGRLFFSV